MTREPPRTGSHVKKYRMTSEEIQAVDRAAWAISAATGRPVDGGEAVGMLASAFLEEKVVGKLSTPGPPRALRVPGKTAA